MLIIFIVGVRVGLKGIGLFLLKEWEMEVELFKFNKYLL